MEGKGKEGGGVALWGRKNFLLPSRREKRKKESFSGRKGGGKEGEREPTVFSWEYGKGRDPTKTFTIKKGEEKKKGKKAPQSERLRQRRKTTFPGAGKGRGGGKAARGLKKI